MIDVGEKAVTGRIFLISLEIQISTPNIFFFFRLGYGFDALLEGRFVESRGFRSLVKLESGW